MIITVLVLDNVFWFKVALDHIGLICCIKANLTLKTAVVKAVKAIDSCDKG